MTSETNFVAGQRWLSESEPELGLGAVVTVGDRDVQLVFRSRDVTRTYARDSAPLRRVRLAPGDRALANDGCAFSIDEVTEDGGVLFYRGGETTISEEQLSEEMDFSSPEERLVLGRTDENQLFDLRFRTHSRKCWLEKLPVRGLLGPQISLLPHQLYVTSEIVDRVHLRVLLGDEVGLGKTIEAGLILHRQLLTGVASRALILLPEPLTHQWFLELWRRFNLRFSVFDEARCSAAENAQPGENPFQESAQVICSLEFLLSAPHRADQAIAADWDVLIVDEAHRLQWSPTAPSEGYRLIARFAAEIPTVLLLSGTPEQLGETGHFARLQLLDPQRFPDLDQFKAEQSGYRMTADIVGKLLDRSPLDEREQDGLARFYHFDRSHLVSLLQAAGKGDAKARDQLIAEIVDRHGTGRLFYRNKRRDIPGFPKRIPKLYPMAMPAELSKLLEDSPTGGSVDQPEFVVPENGRKIWWQYDPRVAAILDLLAEYPDDKMLVIGSRPEFVEGLDSEIKRRINIPTAVFHEGQTLVVRDRQAAYFAEPDGARLLICSEIGSEGRNFQFCHHLVLFDVPAIPDLLEQRIGRLARIGQKQDVKIHILYLQHTALEVWVKWYHEGLDAFRHPLSGAHELYSELQVMVRDHARSVQGRRGNGGDVGDLLRETRAAKQRVGERLEAGRDRLLEWHSNRPEIGERLVEQIEVIESRSGLSHYMEELCQYLGVIIEDHDYNSLVFRAGDAYRGLPGLTEEGLVATYSRHRALAREDTTFLSWDHPMVIGAMDQLLISWDGRVGYGFWEDSSNRMILLEAIFLVDSLAPATLRPERFLPTTPLRVLVNHTGRDLSDQVSHEELSSVLTDDSRAVMLRKREVTQQLIPPMIVKCRDLAEEKKAEIITPAVDALNSKLGQEHDRLRALSAAGAPIRDEEIDRLAEERVALERFFRKAVVRLDALRFIWRGPDPG